MTYLASERLGERLWNTEQTVLLSALSDYMNVLRDAAILELDRANVDVLQEQLRQTRDRFNVGEVTRTDVAQAEASFSGAQASEATIAGCSACEMATASVRVLGIGLVNGDTGARLLGSSPMSCR